MFHSILVPLDGSARAERALPVAAQIARSRNATITLLQVVSDLADVGGYMIPPVAIDNGSIEREEVEARSYLSALAKSDALQGIHVEARVEFGLPARVILDTLKMSDADAVIIASHGRTGLARWMLGSVAQAVVRHASVPVLLLRQQGPALVEDGSQARQFRILVPLDGSDLAEAAIEPAQVIGDVFSAGATYKLHLVRVIPFLNTAMPDNMRDAAHAHALSYLDRITQRLNASSVGRAQITTSVVLEVDVADAIARMTHAGALVTGASSSEGSDLIAMATHGRTGFSRLAIGSVTERVLSATSGPALIIRPQAMKIDAQPAGVNADSTTPSQAWSALY